jgi:hypothetical protein
MNDYAPRTADVEREPRNEGHLQAVAFAQERAMRTALQNMESALHDSDLPHHRSNLSGDFDRHRSARVRRIRFS